ncbi:MAG: adenosylcobinamide kinase/adenosylcobinamide-phosphate guanylyltransferase [Candidatus Pseudothioglobus sp.]|jgi:adenosylcobinamide kinase/adenosylcobinamide-phosphate guanylyltransferase
MLHLILGGARSGKSRHALTVDVTGYSRQLFVATSEAIDEEMQDRIEKHRSERDHSWQTVDAPVNLTTTLSTLDDTTSLIVVDCLTVWLGNLMHYERDVDAEVDKLAAFFTNANGHYVVVSNEVGQGVVPDSKMGREFRDYQGRLNQHMAAIAQRVELVVAGIPINIKS